MVVYPDEIENDNENAIENIENIEKKESLLYVLAKVFGDLAQMARMLNFRRN